MRYFIHKMAKNYKLTGTVKNCPNNTVEAILQGPKTVVNTFVETLKTSSPGYIERIHQDELITSKTYQKFTVKLF